MTEKSESDKDPYAIVAEATHKIIVERLNKSLQLQGDYGKWLIASLLLLNGTALYSLATNVSYGRPILQSGSLWWFLGGLLLAMGSGFVAWINWGLLAADLIRQSNASMLVSRDAWPQSNKSADRYISLTFGLAIVLGLASLACVPIGAVLVAVAIAHS